MPELHTNKYNPSRYYLQRPTALFCLGQPRYLYNVSNYNWKTEDTDTHYARFSVAANERYHFTIHSINRGNKKSDGITKSGRTGNFC